MFEISVEEATTQLTELVKAANEGQTVLIKSSDGGMVQIIPVPAVQPRKKRQFGSASGKIEMAPDFDEPFVNYGNL